MTKTNNHKIKNIIYNSDGINVIFESDEEKIDNKVYNFPKIIIKKSEINIKDNSDDIEKSIKNMIEIMHR